MIHSNKYEELAIPDITICIIFGIARPNKIEINILIDDWREINDKTIFSVIPNCT